MVNHSGSELTLTNSSEEFVKPKNYVDPELIFDKGILLYGI